MSGQHAFFSSSSAGAASRDDATIRRERVYDIRKTFPFLEAISKERVSANIDALTERLQAFGDPMKQEARRQKCANCPLLTKFFHLHLLTPLCSTCVLDPKYRLAPYEVATEFFRLGDDEISDLPYVEVWSGRAIAEDAARTKLYLRSDLERKVESKHGSYMEFLEAMVAEEQRTKKLLSRIDLSVCDDLRGPARPDVALCRPYKLDRSNPSFDGLLFCESRLMFIERGAPFLSTRYVGNCVITVVVGSSRVCRRELWKKQVVNPQPVTKHMCKTCGKDKADGAFPHSSWRHRKTRENIKCKECLAIDKTWPCDRCHRELTIRGFNSKQWARKTVRARYLFCLECHLDAQRRGVTPLKLFNREEKEKQRELKRARLSSEGLGTSTSSTTTKNVVAVATESGDGEDNGRKDGMGLEVSEDGEDNGQKDGVGLEVAEDDDDARSDTTRLGDPQVYYYEDYQRDEEFEDVTHEIRVRTEGTYAMEREIAEEEEEEEDIFA
jgi:hypothetical protein